MTPCGLDGVCVSPSTLINKANAVFDSAVRVTLRVEVLVRCSPNTDDDSPGFDPCIYNGPQSASCSVWIRNEKRFTGLALNTAKHPLLPNRVVRMIFAPTELAIVDPDGLSEQPSMFTNMVYLHNWPKSAIVLGLKRCSRWIMWAGTRRTMSCL